MVLRVWKARASQEGAADYLRHFENVVRPELAGVAGFRGALVLRRQFGDGLEIVVETRWQSLDALAAFAGDDINRAVVEPGARAVLADFDERAVHYEISMEIGGSHDPQTGEQLT